MCEHNKIYSSKKSINYMELIITEKLKMIIEINILN